VITLEKFEEEDFDRFISWIESEEELIQFAGPIFGFPLTRGQLLTYNAQSNRQAFRVRLNSTGQIIGHCELNFQNKLPRLSRILIGDKELRNKGLGRQIVRHMLDVIFSDPTVENADLSVFNWNQNAIASYKKVGFIINEGIETQMTVGTKTWIAVNMIINKQDYLKNKPAIK
jgi:RimJ/RimL family protein N-acetyltransferase